MNTTYENYEPSLNDLLNDPFSNAMGSSGGVRPEDDGRFQNDKKLHVRFFVKPMMNRSKSRHAGRPIYEEIEMIEIMVPGDKHSIPVRRARQLDKARFSRQYQAFKAGKEDQQSGTPLSVVPFMTPAKAEEYKFFHIATVEQLAGAADSSAAAGAVMGFQGDKQKAQAYLQMSEGNAPILEMQQKLEDRDNQIAAMQEQMQQMNSRLAELSSKSKKAAKDEE
jgi:hypothetical protein